MKLVESLLHWIALQEKSALHPVLLAGLIHYLFVSIHPFSDGNGRTTRLITWYFLKKWRYDFRRTLSLDTYYLQHQKNYYDALDRGTFFDDRMQADLTSFIDFFTDGFLATAENLSQYIRVGKVTNEGQKPLRLSAEELTVLDYVYQFGSITIQEAIAATATSKRTTQRRLIDLVEKNILRIEGQGPTTHYVLESNK